jgi:hypothetical protein
MLLQLQRSHCRIIMKHRYQQRYGSASGIFQITILAFAWIEWCKPSNNLSEQPLSQTTFEHSVSQTQVYTVTGTSDMLQTVDNAQHIRTWIHDLWHVKLSEQGSQLRVATRPGWLTPCTLCRHATTTTHRLDDALQSPGHTTPTIVWPWERDGTKSRVLCVVQTTVAYLLVMLYVWV